MMKMFALLYLLLFSINEVVACSCVKQRGSLESLVEQAFNDSTAVVLATVEHIERLQSIIKKKEGKNGEYRETTSYGGQRVQFKTTKSWKGSQSTIFFTKVGNLCSYYFEEKSQYLLYLFGPDDDGNYGTGWCSRTTNYSRAIIEESKILDKIKK